MRENRHVAFDTDLWHANPEAAADKIARLEDHAEKLQAEVVRLKRLLSAAMSSADRNCPCHEETPNPCPKCGASVENLEACRAGELTLPAGLYDEIRSALEIHHEI